MEKGNPRNVRASFDGDLIEFGFLVDKETAYPYHYVIIGNGTMKTDTEKTSFAICKVVCFNKKKIEALRKRIPPISDIESAARRHKVLGHPARQAIICVLDLDECCVCDLANILEKPVSTVSQHLRMLMSSGLLKSRQEGKLVFYSLVPGLSASRLMGVACEYDRK